MLYAIVSAIGHERIPGHTSFIGVITAALKFAINTGTSEVDVGSEHEYIAHSNACLGARGCGEQQHEQ